MDEEIQLINQNTRKEKFKNFILNNKKILIGLFSITILATISIFIFLELKTKNQLKIEEGIKPSDKVDVDIKYLSGDIKKIKTLCRIDTKNELEYYKNGGILQYVLRNMM